MRVVALLVVACGCRVGAGSSYGTDATTPTGDGLPERVAVDTALWSDVGADIAAERTGDGPTAEGAPSDAAGADAVQVGDGGSDGVGDLSPPFDGDGTDGDGSCQLLASVCPARQACYPYPFESAVPGQTRCAFQGVGGASIPCQSQLECDQTSVCAAPGRSDSTCLARCDLLNPRCPVGMACLAYFNHAVSTRVPLART